MEALPGDVVRLLHDVMDPVGAYTRGDNDDETEAEEQDERKALREGQFRAVEGW